MVRQWPQPLLIGSDKTERLPERIPVGSPPFDERRLQEIIAKHPGLLPVQQFDPLFGPPVCIGREVGTSVGRVDNLYISPNGYITLVETKLWKSPEARRQVVAQIIDYAKQVGRWNYSKLEEVFGKHAKDNALGQQSLYEHVCEQTGEDPDQVEFIDAVGRCLQNGRLLLLIVGDGIRESVEEMATYLQQTPNLQFTLGLVEVACYRVPEGKKKESLLLVPRIVTRTAEITRAVVRIQMTEEAAKMVDVSTAIPSDKTPKGISNTLSKDDFYELLTKSAGSDVATKTREFLDSLVPKHDFLQVGFTPQRLSLKLELPDCDENPKAILDIHCQGRIATRSNLIHAFQRNGYPTTIVEAFYRGLGKVHPKLQPKKKPNGSYTVATRAHAPELKAIVSKFGQLETLISALIDEVEKDR
jgi:hypothetical protein